MWGEKEGKAYNNQEVKGTKMAALGSFISMLFPVSLTPPLCLVSFPGILSLTNCDVEPNRDRDLGGESFCRTQL